MTTPKPALIEQLTATDKRVVTLPLDVLPANPTACQLRTARDPQTVKRYAEAYREGAAMPPIVVFEETTSIGPAYHLADGHHRVAGARSAELTEINAIVKPGDRRAAVLYAAGANGQHGLPLTSDDKWAIVATVLADAEWVQWSDREIADRCHVSASLVGKVRAKTGATSNTRKGADGRTRSLPAKKKKIEAPAGAEAGDQAGYALTTKRRQKVESIAKIMVAGDGLLAEYPLTKQMILASLYLGSDAAARYLPPIQSRKFIETLINTALDVHAGQLVNMGQISRVGDDLFQIEALTADRIAALVAKAAAPTPAAEPEEITTAALTAPAPAQEPPKPVRPPKQRPLAERRADWLRATLADRIEAAHSFAGSNGEQAALILLCGADTDVEGVWSEVYVQKASHGLHTTLCRNVAEDLRNGQAHRLPDWRTLARLFGVDYEALSITADRSIPE